MKWAAIILVSAIVIGTLLFVAYMRIGWPYFDMPYPHAIGPMFHLDGESAEDAILIEVWLEFIVLAAIVLSGARFLWRRGSN